MSGYNFDSSTVNGEAGLIPKGTVVKAVVIESSIQEREWGVRMPLVVEVTEGEHSGSRITDGFNLEHTKPTVGAIGQKNLKKLCIAVGVPRFKDTEELHGKPFMLTVGVQEEQNGYDAKNQIGKMKPCEAPAGFEGKLEGEPMAQEVGKEKAPWE
tara:strand:+ start:778 stop:1242 length:465 start_codon:yes stop_codon:yes gene_type:complete